MSVEPWLRWCGKYRGRTQMELPVDWIVVMVSMHSLLYISTHGVPWGNAKLRLPC